MDRKDKALHNKKKNIQQDTNMTNLLDHLGSAYSSDNNVRATYGG